MRKHRSGFTLIEALIALVVLSIGLLGLAKLQVSSRQFETESYQRAFPRVMIDQPTGKLLSPCACVVLLCGVEQWPPGEVDIGGLPW